MSEEQKRALDALERLVNNAYDKGTFGNPRHIWQEERIDDIRLIKAALTAKSAPVDGDKK